MTIAPSARMMAISTEAGIALPVDVAATQSCADISIVSTADLLPFKPVMESSIGAYAYFNDPYFVVLWGF
jgi:hypothetical protein